MWKKVVLASVIVIPLLTIDFLFSGEGFQAKVFRRLFLAADGHG